MERKLFKLVKKLRDEYNCFCSITIDFNSFKDSSMDCIEYTIYIETKKFIFRKQYNSPNIGLKEIEDFIKNKLKK